MWHGGVRLSDEPVAVEETDVTDAEPTELLSLLLTSGLRTDETNRYEPVLGHSDTEESGSD